MNAGELINALAERTGYMSDELKTLLAAPALTQITLPEDFKKVVNTNLMTIGSSWSLEESRQGMVILRGHPTYGSQSKNG